MNKKPHDRSLAIQSNLSMLSLFIVRRVPESVGRVPERMRLGAMRSVRANMLAVGMAFVNNTNLILRKGRR